MKVFEINYYIARLLRRARGRFKKSLQRKEVTFTTVLRILSLGVIFFNVFFDGVPQPATPPTPVSSGVVLSQTVAAPGVSSPKPVRIADAPDFGTFLGRAALVEDATSSAVLYEKNPDEKLPPASLTKMMTALLTLKNADLNKEVTVSPECPQVSGLTIGLKEGQKFSVKSLLYALLLPSAADAACALSENTVPQATTSAQFVKVMNSEAQSLGLSNTHFGNPSGVDDTTDDNYSSARDLLALARADLGYAEFGTMVDSGAKTIINSDGRGTFSLKTTNELLALNDGFGGIKTGYTDKALGCLAFLYRRGGHEVLGIILGSPDRFADAKNLVDWIFKSYEWR